MNACVCVLPPASGDLSIVQARASVLRGGADAVGRFAVDLIKKQKSRSGVLDSGL